MSLPLEPTALERASAVLAIFTREWNLSLNPEDLDEMAWAVLLHAQDTSPWNEQAWEALEIAVMDQIAEVRESRKTLYADWNQARRARQLPEEDPSSPAEKTG